MECRRFYPVDLTNWFTYPMDPHEGKRKRPTNYTVTHYFRIRYAMINLGASLASLDLLALTLNQKRAQNGLRNSALFNAGITTAGGYPEGAYVWTPIQRSWDVRRCRKTGIIAKKCVSPRPFRANPRW